MRNPTEHRAEWRRFITALAHNFHGHTHTTWNRRRDCGGRLARCQLMAYYDDTREPLNQIGSGKCAAHKKMQRGDRGRAFHEMRKHLIRTNAIWIAFAAMARHFARNDNRIRCRQYCLARFDLFRVFFFFFNFYFFPFFPGRKKFIPFFSPLSPPDHPFEFHRIWIILRLIDGKTLSCRFLVSGNLG